MSDQIMSAEEVREACAKAVENLPEIELSEFAFNKWSAVALTKHVADKAIRALDLTRIQQ